MKDVASLHGEGVGPDNFYQHDIDVAHAWVQILAKAGKRRRRSALMRLLGKRRGRRLFARLNAGRTL